MSTKPTTVAQLRRLRQRMDELNARLAALLQERARLASRIGEGKRDLGLRARDAARERQMLARVLREAPSGFSRAELTRIFRLVVRLSRERVARETRRPR